MEYKVLAHVGDMLTEFTVLVKKNTKEFEASEFDIIVIITNTVKFLNK
jgi:hypothetical protein